MSTRFRGGAQSDSHRSGSTPCPPNRTCGSPASGSPVGSCISHTERQFGAASSHRRSLAVPVALRAPGSQKLHGFTRGAPLRHTARPVHALSAPSLQSVSPAPSLTHVMLRNSLPLHAGFIGKATPAGLRPSVIPPHLRPLSSTGVTPRLQSYRPLRHPGRPGLPLAGFRLPRARHRLDFPCCYAFHLPCMPAPRLSTAHWKVGFTSGRA